MHNSESGEGTPGSIREKHHRLRPETYVGNIVVAFTINAAKRIPYFNDTDSVVCATEALAEAFKKHHGHVGIYVFMPDHVHLMLSGQGCESNLLDLVGEFKQKTCFRVRKMGKDFGWQKDFYDHIVRANEDYGAQVRYVLRNPVRRGLCERWQDWPHKGVLGVTWEELAVSIATL